MVILVTGANGQLGNEMQIVAKNSNDKYIFTDVCDGYEKLDITDLDAVRRAVKGKVLIASSIALLGQMWMVQKIQRNTLWSKN